MAERKHAPGEKKYAFKQKSVALTCSAWMDQKLPIAEFSAWVVANYVELQPWGLVEDYCFSQETHSDGKIHYHGYLKFAVSYAAADASRIFDREHPLALQSHCHIKSCRSAKAWLAYVQKDGDFTGNVTAIPKKDPALGYLRKKADRAAYDADMKYAGLPVISDEKLRTAPWGMDLLSSDKRRHYYVQSPPDHGKTTLMHQLFAGTRGLYCRAKNHLYPYEGYQGERYILIDDFDVTLPELLDVTNTPLIPCERWGHNRYARAYWPCTVNKTVIVLSNRLPDYAADAAFLARFRILQLDHVVI